MPGRYGTEDLDRRKTGSFSLADIQEEVPADPSIDAAMERGGRAVVGQFGVNAWNSAGRFVGDVAKAVASPLQTAKAVGNLAVGAVEKAIPGEQGAEKHVDALVNLYIEKYGGIENLKKSMYQDPVGFLADISTVVGGVGLAGKGVQIGANAARLGRTANVAGQISRTAGAVSRATDPITLAGKAVIPLARAAKIGDRFSPANMYKSALKPSTTLPVDKVNKMVETGLEARIPVTEGGLEKLWDLVDDLQTKVKATIAGSTKTISPGAVAQRADDVKPAFVNQVNPVDDLAAIDASKNEFLAQHTKKVQTGIDAHGKPITSKVSIPIPAVRAQAIKQGTYRQLTGKAYGEMKTATKEAQKALARGLKEELAAAIPELANLNARESALLGLEPALERAVRRIDNHQLFGIGTPIAMAGVHGATGSSKLAAAAGIIRGIIDNPQMKSRLAIWINYAQKKTHKVGARPNMATAATRVQEYIDSLEAATVLAEQNGQGEQVAGR